MVNHPIPNLPLTCDAAHGRGVARGGREEQRPLAQVDGGQLAVRARVRARVRVRVRARVRVWVRVRVRVR